jgi:hypothetical protein
LLQLDEWLDDTGETLFFDQRGELYNRAVHQAEGNGEQFTTEILS